MNSFRVTEVRIRLGYEVIETQIHRAVSGHHPDHTGRRTQTCKASYSDLRKSISKTVEGKENMVTSTASHTESESQSWMVA